MKKHLIIFLLTLLFFYFFIPQSVDAILYNPGETLEPECGPDEDDCGIKTSVYTSDAMSASALLFSESDTVWSLLPPGTDGQVLKISGTNLSWGADTDTDTNTTYTASGNGLELSGTQFALELDGTTLSNGTNGLKIDDTLVSNWNEAHGWGDHADAGYVTGTPWTGLGYITDGNAGWDNSYGFIADGNAGWDNSYGFITGLNVSQLTSGEGIYLNYKPNNVACSDGQVLKYLATTGWVCANDTDTDTDTNTTYTASGSGLELSGTQFALELDGTTLSNGASGLKIDDTLVSNWNEAHGWGNHADAGYVSALSLNSGSVIFSNGTGLSQDNVNFYWDDDHNRLGIGTASPTQALTLVGNMDITGDIVATADNTYSLGSLDKVWKDLYVGNGSIYVDGQKVLQTDISDSVVVSADDAQNLILKTTGGGNIELNPAAGGGQLLLKSNISLTGGKTISTSDDTAIIFSDGISTPSITTDVLNGGIAITPNGSGNTYITTGNFGIGDTSPAALLTVGSGDLFQINTSGDIVTAVAEGLSITTGTTGALTLDSGTTGAINLGTGANAKTITIGNNTTTTGLVFNSGSTGINFDSNTLFVDSANDKVGIGTVSPTQKLDVDGYTKAAGFCIGASCITSWPTSGLTGSGTTNYFAKWTSSSTLGNGLIYDDGINIGIGTTTPAKKLDVVGSIIARPSGSTTGINVIPSDGDAYLNVTRPANTNIAAITMAPAGAFSSDNVIWYMGMKINSNDFSIFTWPGSGGTTDRLTVTNAGNIGIGTASPAEKLHVVGNIRNSVLAGTGTRMIQADVDGKIIALSAGTASQVLLGTGVWGTVPGSEGSVGWDLSGNVGTTASTAAIGSTVNNNFIGTTDAKDFVFTTNSLERMRITSAGDIGIGTITPESKLEVKGASAAAGWIETRTRNTTATGAAAFRVDNDLGTSYWDFVIHGSSFAGNLFGMTRAGKPMMYSTGGTAVVGTYDNNDFVLGTNNVENLRIKSGGNVGIGTNAPGSLLHIKGAGIVSSGWGYFPVVIQETNNHPGILFRNNSGTDLGLMRANSSGGIDIRAEGGDVVLYTGTTSVATDRFHILNSNGNVGVGSTSPENKIHILATSGHDAGLLIQNTGTGATDNPAIVLKNGAGTLATLFQTTAAWSGGGETTGFYTAAANGFSILDSLGSRVFNVLQGGRIGIGTINPTVGALQISGGSSFTELPSYGTVAIGHIVSTTGWDGSGFLFTNSTTGSKAFSMVYNADKAWFGGLDASSQSAWMTLNSNGLAVLGTGNSSFAGKVGVATSSPSYRFQVGETSNYGYVDATGAWQSSSDARYKENIRNIDSAVDLVMQISGIRYNTIGDNFEQIGFSAQDLEKILPEIVSTDLSGNKGVAYAKITPVLVNAIKEQQEEINLLKASLTVLISDLDRGVTDGALSLGEIDLGKDSAGEAVIKAGNTEVEIIFENTYNFQPIVTVTANDFMIGNYRITGKNLSGFNVELSEIQNNDIKFDWHAFGSKEGLRFFSDGFREDINSEIQTEVETVPEVIELIPENLVDEELPAEESTEILPAEEIIPPTELVE